MQTRVHHRYGFPLSAITSGFGIGVLSTSQVQIFSLGLLAWLTVAAAFAGMHLFKKRLVKPVKLATWALLMICAICTGGYRWQAWTYLPETHITGVEIPPHPVAIAGIVQSVPEKKSRSIQLELNVTRLYLDEAPAPKTGLLLVNLPHGGTFPQAGDLIVLTGLLRQPPSQQNPGSFDYGRYLRLKNIHLILDAASWQFLDKASPTGFNHRFILPARHFIRQSIDTYVKSESSRSILSALLLGDTSTLADDIKASFRNTGLMHVLAVSGLHVLLVGLVVYGLLRPFLLRLHLSWRYMEWTRMILTMSILAIYAQIAGGHASVVRAVIMASLMILGTVFQRSAISYQSLSVAALVLLFIQPSFIFDVGFQLSFSAVLGILVLTPRLKAMYEKRKIPSWVSNLLDTTSVSVAAMVGTFPVLIQHFGTVSFAGLILNLPALPLTAATLGAGLMMLLFACFSSLLAATMGAAADLFASLLVFSAQQGSAYLGILSTQAGSNNLWVLFCWLLVLILILNATLSARKWRTILTIVSLPCVILWWKILTSAYTPDLSVLFFNVGHGDAALIHLPNNKTLLIDTGPQYRETNAGARIIYPFLEEAQISKLDAVIVTHPHADHLGGLPTLLEKLPVDRLVFNGVFHTSGLFNRVQRMADSLNLSIETKVAGDTLLLDASVRIRVLSPSPELRSHTDLNEGSLVVQIQYGGSSFLFLGDAEQDAEAFLVNYFTVFLRSNVVKVGHHGSRTSSSIAFVKEVAGVVNNQQRHAPASQRPVHAVVSSGPQTIYDLPDEDVLERWHQAGLLVHITAEDQALWLISDGQEVSVKHW